MLIVSIKGKGEFMNLSRGVGFNFVLYREGSAPVGA